MQPDAEARSASALLLAAAASGVLASALAAADTNAAALGVAAGAALLLTRGARGVVGHWTSMAVMFCGFFALYGLSGPLHALMGERLADLFTFPYRTSAFLEQQGLATAGLACGLLVASVTITAAPEAGTNARRASDFNFPIVAGVLCIACASLFELITFIRVGGLGAIALGKAVYQSRASEMSLTLPSDEVATLGLAMAALWFASEGRRRTRRERVMAAAALAVAALPVVGIALSLGRRGPLFAWVLVWVVGRAMYQPLRRIPAKALVFGLALTVASGVLFASRATLAFGVATGDWSAFGDAVTDVPRIVTALNPAESEFGAAFGNFSEFEHRGEEPRRLGSTYLTGLATLIPGSLYPGRKPLQITYEFRDRYFPSEASRGLIAGTGFSSILEAYLNFGSIGVFVLYGLTGAVLLFVERLRRIGPYGRLAYLLFIPLTQSYHRSALSVVIGTAMLTAYLLIAVRGSALAAALTRLALTRPSPGATSSSELLHA